MSLDGRETLISILGPGEFFGESSLLSGTEVTFSAGATKRSELLQLPERKFKLLLEDPQACRMLLEIMARRCNDAWAQMDGGNGRAIEGVLEDDVHLTYSGYKIWAEVLEAFLKRA